MKKILYILFLSMLSFTLTAQETEWMFGVVGVVGVQSQGLPLVCRSVDGNIILANSFSSLNNGSFQFKGANISVSNPINSGNLLISSITPDSSLIWAFSTDISTNIFIFPVDITTDEVGNIYLLISYSGSNLGNITFSSNISLSYNRFGRRNAIVKFDKNGNPLWAREYGRTTLDPFSQLNDKISYSEGRLYVAHLLRGVMEYSGTTQTFIAVDNRNQGILAYDTSSNFLWVKQYGSVSTAGSGRRDFKAVRSALYFTAHFDKEYIYNSDTLDPGFYLIQLDTMGMLANYVYIKYATAAISGYSGIKFEIDPLSGSVYMGFPFQDSIEILSRKEISKTNKGNPLSFCLLKINRQMDSVEWCNCQDTSQGFISPVAGLLLDNNNLYFGGELGGDSIYFRKTLFNGGGSALFIAKADTLGNLLWGFSNIKTKIFTQVSSIAVDTLGNLFLAGAFYGKVVIFGDSLTNNNINEHFLAKITDYSITRGEVSSGPYCAGDTFLVPYTQKGTYDTANFFIAELSDENGKFEGGERELGRIKATEDSTIIGQLPLFQVASSPNYRIRVRSTNPPVQSFFLKDSLRLLIYSRDKANPGPTETACFGDSFMLNTFGGTAWQWSPAYRMDNPNARNPKIYPDKDTIFQIIISDSSGCGAPDTAFKQILIRSNPKIQTDSLVEACLNIDAALMAHFSKGDSSGYRWTWYLIQDSSNWQALKTDSFSTTDTFFYRYPADSTGPTNFAVVLTDGCSIIKDTAYTTVILTTKPMRGALSTIDTLICYQSAQTLIANFTGGDSNTYRWQWNEAAMGANFNPLQSDSLKTTDSLAVQLLPQNRQTQRYALVSKDGCTPIVDTAYFTFDIAQNQPQATLLPQDSAICPGTAINLQVNISAGTALGYHWKWLDENETLLQSDTGFVVNPLTVTPDFSTQTAQKYTFILMDNCSPYSDTATTTVLPRADLQAMPSKLDTTLCRGQSIVLNATGTGGVTADYVFRWLAKERDTVLSTTNKLTLIADTSMSVLLVLSDNCMPQNDTVTIAIKVKPSLQVALITQAGTQALDTTVCNGTAINYTLNNKGGDSTNYAYNWYWNDSLISTAKTLNFTPTENKTTPTTHHLKLILKDGCTAANDTTSIAVTILPPINAFFTASDTLCLGQATTITANATGGKESAYTYQWYWNNRLISTANPLNFKSSSANNASLTANNLKLETADGCTAPNDSFTYTIYVKPALALSLTTPTNCATPTVALTANTVGGNPNSYAVRWWDEKDNAIGTGNSITVNPTALTTYKAILTDGCSADSAFAAIQIDKLPADIKLTASPVQGCEPLTVTFELQTNYPSAYTAKWSLNTDTSNISNTLQKTFLAGNYAPKVQFTSTLGCDTILAIPALVVHPNPSAAFDYSPQQPDLDSSEVRFKNQSTGAINYNWNIAPFGNFTDFEPTVNYTDTGNFTVKLEAISDQGCRDTAEGSLYLRAHFRIYLPNAFSPNGDEINDFYIPYLSGFSEMTFTIYNGWGEQIYETKNNKAWDGTFDGKNAPMGYYYYLLQVKSLAKVRKNTSGSFLLMR